MRARRHELTLAAKLRVDERLRWPSLADLGRLAADTVIEQTEMIGRLAFWPDEVRVWIPATLLDLVGSAERVELEIELARHVAGRAQAELGAKNAPSFPLVLLANGRSARGVVVSTIPGGTGGSVERTEPMAAATESLRTRPLTTAAIVVVNRANGAELFISDGDSVEIGREENTLGLEDDETVSALHARITWPAGARTATIEDLESLNGTSLNRREITGPMPQSTGDTIEVGVTSLGVYDPGGRSDPPPAASR